MSTIEKVGVRVYREGVLSSRTASALSLITQSQPLREAVEADDPAAARAAAQALIATGHMTDLQVASGTQVLADVDKLGYPSVLITGLMFLATFYILGLAAVACGRLRLSARTKPAIETPQAS